MTATIAVTLPLASIHAFVLSSFDTDEQGLANGINVMPNVLVDYLERPSTDQTPKSSTGR
jgi:hypothetical protein